MSTNFPTSIDTFPTVLSTDNLNTSGKEHDVLHNNLKDSVLALEAKVGIDGSSVSTSLDYRVSTLESDKLYFRSDTLVASTGNDTITLDKSPYNSPSLAVMIYVNGLRLNPSHVSWSSNVGTLSSAASSGDVFVVDYWSNTSQGATTLTTASTSFWYDNIVSSSSHAIVFDLNDLSTLYSDTSHTTLVTGTGDTVKAIANKGTGGGYAISSTGSTLQYDSTHNKYYIVPPSTNGFQMTSAPSAMLGHINRSVIVVGELQGNTSNYEYLFQFGLDSDGNGHHLVIGNVQSDGQFEMFSGGSGGGISGGAYQSGLKVYIGTADISAVSPSDQFKLYAGSTTALNTGTVNACSITTGTISLGDYTTTNSAKIAKFYSFLIVDRVITSTEISTAISNAL